MPLLLWFVFFMTTIVISHLATQMATDTINLTTPQNIAIVQVGVHHLIQTIIILMVRVTIVGFSFYRFPLHHELDTL